mgnify:CR=1 FL=1
MSPKQSSLICPRCFDLVSQELRKYILPHEARDVIEILRRQTRPPHDGVRTATFLALILALLVVGVSTVSLSLLMAP